MDKIKVYLRYLMYIIIIEVILGGSGRIIEFKSISLRMFLYGIAILLFIICLIIDRKNLKANIRVLKPDMFFFIAFILWIIFSAVNGYLKGNSLGQIKGDITGFISIVLIFVFLYAFDKKEHFNKIAKLISIFVFIQSIAVILIYSGIEAGLLTFDFVNSIIRSLNLGALGKVVPNTTRVFLKSSIFIQIGILIQLGMLQKETSLRERRKSYLFLIIDAYALIVTFTRGFWIASAVSILIYIFLKGFKKFIKPCIVILLGISLLIGLNYAVNRKSDVVKSILMRSSVMKVQQEDMIDNEDVSSINATANRSSDYRINLKAAMFKRIKEKPLLGSGFGVVCIEAGQQLSHSEYIYYDILMEMGAIGLIIFTAIFALIIIRWLTIRKRVKTIDGFYYMDEYILGLLSVVITSAVNPFLNNPIGITYLLIVFAAVSNYYKSLGPEYIK